MDAFSIGMACFVGAVAAATTVVGVAGVVALIARLAGGAEAGYQRPACRALAAHFAPEPLETLRITRREFPAPIRVDLQRAIEGWIAQRSHDSTLHGVYVANALFGTSFNELIQTTETAGLGPPRYDDVDIGDSEPVATLQNGLWLARLGPRPVAILLASGAYLGQTPPLQVEVAVSSKDDLPLAHELFSHIEKAVRESGSYRGKVLSLEASPSFSGAVAGFTVHKLPALTRDELILPQGTLDALDRNVIEFARHRPSLIARGLSGKKGLLLHGPPGTGKTHTIRYLAAALKGHTILLATAEQVANIANYMALARLLQPSVLVLEDVDLIGRNREEIGSPCGEALLNRLLNEMDGLGEDAQVTFLLTTNRPESLEDALAARPGRVDQAIEFPLPDEEGRSRLIELYGRGIAVDARLIDSIVARTEGVSAALLKELMRRTYQYQLADPSLPLTTVVDQALSEMLEQGGTINRRLYHLSGGNIGFMPAEIRPGVSASRCPTT